MQVTNLVRVSLSVCHRQERSSKKERAAQAAKRREDPGQQQKSGAAKPTNVKTDRKVRKEDMDINERPKTRKVRVVVQKMPVIIRSSLVILYGLIRLR